jgi:hypothetical protein
LTFLLQVPRLGHRPGRDVGDLVRHRDQWHVLALSEDVAGLLADRLRVRGPRARRRRPRALHAGVHVRLVVVTDEEHVVAALEHAREAGEADVDRAAVAGLPDDANVLAPLRPQRRGDAAGDRGGVAEQRVNPGKLPRRLRIRGREHLQAPGRVGGDHAAARRSHRGVEHVARAERLAAALAGAVARGQRVGALHARLDRALIRVEQAIADRVSPDLVVLDLLLGHQISSV